MTPSTPSSEADRERIEAGLRGLDGASDPFVSAVRTTRMPMVVTDPQQPDNPIVFVNDAFCRLTGYERAEMLGRNCRFLQGPESDPAAVARVREAVRTATTIEIDLRNYRKDGTPFWNRLLLAPVRDRAGTLAYFFASQIDVTFERERVAGLESQNAALLEALGQRLRAQEEGEARLRFATEGGRLGIVELDLSTDLLTVSPLAKRVFGVEPQAPFTYADLRAVVDPQDKASVVASANRSIVSGADLDVEFRVTRPGDRTGWIQLRAQVLKSPDGTALRLAGTVADITARRRADERRQTLLELDDRFRSLDDPSDLAYAGAEALGRTLEVSRAGYGTVDPLAETITIARDWNAPGIVTLAGTLRFRDYGSYIDDLKAGRTVVCSDADLDPRTAVSAHRLKSISAQAFINMPITERGEIVALLYLNSAQARDWPEEEMAFVREVALRTRMAVERRRAEQDARELAATLEQQVAFRTAQLMETEAALRQSQKMEAVGQLTGGVAHDFNNLLTVIRSSTDLLKRPSLTDERRARYIAAIADTVDRAAKLTGQLLAFARRQALSPEVFDVGQSLTTLGDMLRTITGSRIRVATRLPVERCYIHADPSQFDTAVVNMVINARDAMGGEGVLTLAVSMVGQIPALRGHAVLPGDFVAVSVSDTGSGIAPELLDRIFEPFFTTKGVGQGTGLGLSQVYGFSKQSGGEVAVRSAPGEGATFTLYLPRADGPGVTNEAEALPALVDGHGTRVLVVEDNADVGTFATQTLAELGYAPVLATSGEQALAELADGADRFDVVFSDVIMPGMNGIELGQAIRSRYKDLPVVLTSGYSHVLAQNGSHGFELLHKPYSIEELSRVLRKAATWHRRTRMLSG